MHVRKNGTSGALSPPRCRDCHRPVLHVPKLRRDAAILKNVRFRLDPMLARDSHMMHVPRVAVPRAAGPRALPRVAVPRCRGLRCRETRNACRGSQCRGPCRGSQCRGAAGCGAAKRETPAAGRSAAGLAAGRSAAVPRAAVPRNAKRLPRVAVPRGRGLWAVGRGAGPAVQLLQFLGWSLTIARPRSLVPYAGCCHLLLRSGIEGSGAVFGV
jgi:hypothetical protein